jgi:hypothetical protein
VPVEKISPRVIKSVTDDARVYGETIQFSFAPGA